MNYYFQFKLGIQGIWRFYLFKLIENDLTCNNHDLKIFQLLDRKTSAFSFKINFLFCSSASQAKDVELSLSLSLGLLFLIGVRF